MSAPLRLVADNELAPREQTALRLVEAVARARVAVAFLRGPERAALDADLEQLSAIALRVVVRMVEWRTRLWTGKTPTS